MKKRMQVISNNSALAPARPELYSVPFRSGRAIQTLALSLALYVFFLAFAFLVSRSGVPDQISLALVHAGGALALLAFWRLGRWGRAKFDCFGAALLLIGAVFKVHGLIDALFYGTRIEDIYQYRSVPVSGSTIDLLFKGESITVFGLMLVACSWRLAVGSRVEQFSFFLNARQVPQKLSMLVYLAALGVDILRKGLGIELGPLQQVTSLLFGFGVASIYFIAIRKDTAKRQIAMAGILALPMVFLALGGGMKEEMFFPFIPAAILYWMRYRNFGARTLALVLGIAVLSLSQIYVHYVRDQTWQSKGNSGNVDMSTGELVAGFGSRAESMRSMDAMESMSSRINLTVSHAITVTLADHHGFEPMNVFGPIPASLVPRLFWPNKPVIQPGTMQTARILGGRIPISRIGTSTAAGFVTELYLGGWWFGVILGTIAYGTLLGGVQKWSLRHAEGFGHQALCFLALYWTIRFDEKHVVYAYTGVIFTAVFIWLLVRASKMFGLRLSTDPKRSRKQVGSVRPDETFQSRWNANP